MSSLSMLVRLNETCPDKCKITGAIARELRMPYKTVWGAIKKIQKAAKFFQRHAKA